MDRRKNREVGRSRREEERVVMVVGEEQCGWMEKGKEKEGDMSYFRRSFFRVLLMLQSIERMVISLESLSVSLYLFVSLWFNILLLMCLVCTHSQPSKKKIGTAKIFVICLVCGQKKLPCQIIWLSSICQDATLVANQTKTRQFLLKKKALPLPKIGKARNGHEPNIPYVF